MAGKQRLKRLTKGVFSPARLPIAGRYLHPGRRRAMLLAALAGCGVAALALAASFLIGGARAASPGPVSSNHANFEGQCSACHQPFADQAESAVESCRGCHERVGDRRGVYGFAAHYAYRGGAGRAPGAPDDGRARREVACAACHPEHRGRDAPLTEVADERCLPCHDFGSFNRRHPEFAYAREELPDPTHLVFSHRPHVGRLKREMGFEDPQLACLYCHEAEADGAGFAPLDFDRHCGACHLSPRTRTPSLPAGDPADADSPGVLTLEAILRAGGPDTRWAYFLDPREVTERGGQVFKRPVYHQDPWVMENLRRIRRVLYPDLDLAALLATALPAGEAGNAAALTREALDTLRRHAEDLRARPEPEVRDELRRVEQLLAAAEERLRRGEAPVDPAAFASPPRPDPELAPERAAALGRLALDLTEPCRTCHVVSGAAVLRVGADQRALTAAEFNHRAHLLQRPICVDCHGAIPELMTDLAPEETVSPLDAAATWNLPTLETCRQCHTPEEASNRCVTCHLFHPDKGRHADLVVYHHEDAAAAGGSP